MVKKMFYKQLKSINFKVYFPYQNQKLNVGFPAFVGLKTGSRFNSFSQFISVGLTEHQFPIFNGV